MAITTNARRARPDLNAFAVPTGTEEVRGTLFFVDRERIAVKRQVRDMSTLDQHELDGLAESISEGRKRGRGVAGSGLQMPLSVQRDPDSDRFNPTYILITGHRRLLAIQQLQRAKHWDSPAVPVLLVEGANDPTTVLDQLIENMQRQDLNPVEEAKAFDGALKETGVGVRTLAQILGKSSGYVENRLRLLRTSDDVQQMVKRRRDTISIAPAINKIPDATKRAALISKALKGGSEATVIRLGNEVKEILNPTQGQSTLSGITIHRSSTDAAPSFIDSERRSADEADDESVLAGLRLSLHRIERALSADRSQWRPDITAQIDATLQQMRQALDAPALKVL